MHYLSFTWNPSEGIDLGFFMIRYYSLMFVVAFTLGWILTKKIFEREGQPQEKLDKLFIYIDCSISCRIICRNFIRTKRINWPALAYLGKSRLGICRNGASLAVVTHGHLCSLVC